MKNLRSLVQVALIALSVAIILNVTRVQEARTVFWILFFIECGVSTMILWRRGLLTLTPAQIHARIVADGPVMTTPLERWATALGFIAAVMLLFLKS